MARTLLREIGALLLVERCVGRSRLYWLDPTHKAQYKGLGNQLWERSSQAALYRIADSLELSPNGRLSVILGNLLGHAHYTHAAASESCMWDTASHPVLATWEDVVDRSLPVLTPNCVKALEVCRYLQIVDATQSNASFFVVSYGDAGVRGFNRCVSATPESACQRADRDESFVWIGQALDCFEEQPRSLLKPRDTDFLFPMASPLFDDRHKKRYCGKMSFKSGDQRTKNCRCAVPFSPESGLEASTPELHQALATVDFAPAVKRITETLVKFMKVSHPDKVNAIHVRRGDRLHSVWQKKLLYLADRNCTSCDTCLYHCAPSNDDILGVGRNFSHPEFPTWIATDDASTAFLFEQPHRNSYFGLEAADVAAIVRDHPAFLALPSQQHRKCVKEGIDLYFLTYANSAIFDVASTFSAIAYRKREALDKPFQFW